MEYWLAAVARVVHVELRAGISLTWCASMLNGFSAIVEVRRGRGGTLPRDGIVATYLASRRGPILMVLDGVTAEECDRVLDPVVMQVHEPMGGVAYASRGSAEDSPTPGSEEGSPFQVDESLQNEARHLGIPWISVHDAGRLFGEAAAV